MRPAAKLNPAQLTMFSPPVLISRPAPSPRSAHATHLVTSKPPSTVRAGLMWLWMQATSTPWSPAALQPTVGSAARGGAGGGGGFGVANANVTDHGLVCAPSNA